MTTKTCWWLVDILSRTLDPEEAAAVRGDLAESGATGLQALRDVWGLVIRRQAAVWNDWRPWLALAGVIPLDILLSLVSRRFADGDSIYIWLYANNWDREFLIDGAYWHELVRHTESGLVAWLALACWSWTAGFVVGALSRRTIWASGALYALMLMLAALPGGASFSGHLPLPYTARNLSLHAVVFEHRFYRVMLPIIVQAVLVLFPSLWGMRRGLTLASNRSLVRSILWVAVIITLAGLIAQDWIEVWAWFRPSDQFTLSAVSASLRLQMRHLQLVVYWPVVYLIAEALRRHWRGVNRHANPQRSRTSKQEA